jgi:hypothetical protein
VPGGPRLDRNHGWRDVLQDQSQCHLLDKSVWEASFQEQAFGGLDRESLMFLDGLARRGVSPRRHLKPGTVLVRDYQGERHTVTVGREGFEWQGTTYPSLSAIARAITGTAWSGPRFFALRTSAVGAPSRDPGAKRGSKSDDGPTSRSQHPGAVRSSGTGSPRAARATPSRPMNHP